MAHLIQSIQEMNSVSKGFQVKGYSIALVPTMGALHMGHRMLMRRGRSLADQLVVSIFLNPLQFSPSEDIDRYPSNLEKDLEICEAEGVDVVFAPKVQDVYQPDASCFVAEEGLSQFLEGRSRPTHFRGVTTIVAKLFNLVEPDVAIFGQKDYQQYCIIRRMIRDLNYPIELIMAPTVREPDGLALSSRNQYLSHEERKQATCLRTALLWVEKQVEQGNLDTAVLRQAIEEQIAQHDLVETDYIAFVNRFTLEDLVRVQPEQTLLALAAYVGRTRLIDNIIL